MTSVQKKYGRWEQNARSCNSHIYIIYFLLFQNFPPLISALSGKQISSNNLFPCKTSPGCVWVYVCECMVRNASAAPWISVVSRGMEGRSYETLPCWHIGSVEHELQLHRAEFQSSSSSWASRPETSSLQTSLTAPDAWTTHQHQLPPEMENMVLRKVENWEACQVASPRARKRSETEAEIRAQSCNTATRQKGNFLWPWIDLFSLQMKEFLITREWLRKLSVCFHSYTPATRTIFPTRFIWICARSENCGISIKIKDIFWEIFPLFFTPALTLNS